MTKLIFVTHPSVAINPDIPVNQWSLSDEGWNELKRLIKKSFWKEVDVLYSSNENKALRAAEQIVDSFTHIDFPIPFGDDFLREIDRSSTGYIAPKQYEQAMQEFYSSPQVSYKGWETATGATIRITSVLNELMKDHQGTTVAMVSHGAIGTLLVCWLKGIHPTMSEDPQKQGCIMEIDWDNKRVLTPWTKY